MINNSKEFANRKKDRLISSLLDLKLQINNDSKKTIPEEELKRKQQKFSNIKLTNNDNKIYQNFTVVQKKKSIVDKKLISKSLQQHFVFTNLIKNNIIHQNLIDRFKFCKINKQQYLLKQNDNASSFFILHHGQLIVQIDGIQKKKIIPGQGFGELALLYTSPRSASIKANNTSYLWFIDRMTFRIAVSALIQKNYHETVKFLQQTPFFTYLTLPQKDKLASIAINLTFSKGQTICKMDEMASSMYIVKYGFLQKQTKTSCSKLFQGNYFGEYTLLQKNSRWTETVIALQQTQLIAIGVEDIQKILGRSVPLIVIRNHAQQCMNLTNEFAKLSSQYKNIILDCFKIRNVGIGENICSEQKLFLVVEGDYQIVKGKDIGKIVKEIDGEKRLFGSMVQNTIEEIKFSTNGKIAWTTPQEVLIAFNGTYEKAVQKSVAIQKTAIRQRDHIANLRLECSKYKITDFKVVTKLGEGQFGTVFLVTDPSKTQFYALKCISKLQTVNNKLEKYLINEKQIMQQINQHTQFSVNFIRSFKDDKYIYFLMQYINGLELFDVIRIIGLLNSQQTRFYSAIIVQFLQKCHKNNIIYRDLKPQNVMVEEDGYLKMIDMGTCKKLEIGSCQIAKKTFTIIGTPNYMAPQIITGKGYSCSADLWSLGIIMYEFMAGEVPFGEQFDDPYRICQQILKKPLKFPIYMNDQKANSLIRQLLNKTPEIRLGGSFNALKRHQFFREIDWSLLVEKRQKPAFTIPKDKLIEVQKQINKVKDISSLLVVSNKIYNKKENKQNYNKWDQCF